MTKPLSKEIIQKIRNEVLAGKTAEPFKIRFINQ